jgi:hypothetical protein
MRMTVWEFPCGYGTGYETGGLSWERKSLWIPVSFALVVS